MPLLIFGFLIVGMMIFGSSRSHRNKQEQQQTQQVAQTQKEAPQNKYEDEIKKTTNTVKSPEDPYRSVQELAGPSTPKSTSNNNMEGNNNSGAGNAGTPPSTNTNNTNGDQAAGNGNASGNLENLSAENNNNSSSTSLDGNELSPDVYYPDKARQAEGKLVEGSVDKQTKEIDSTLTNKDKMDPNSKAAFIENLRRIMKNFPKDGYRIDKDGNVILPDGSIISGKEFMDRIMTESASESNYSTASLFSRSSKDRSLASTQSPQDLIGPPNANIFGMVETRIKTDRKSWGL